MKTKEYLKILIKYIILFLMSFTRIIPVNKKRFFFSNYFGKSGFGDNLKYIAEELHERDSSFEIFWAVEKNYVGNFPDYVKVVKNGSLAWLLAVITSKYWIDNERKHLYVYKKPQQFYLQTWHGGVALKQIELDAVESYPEKASYIVERKHDNKIANAFISNSDFCTNMYRNAFNYQGDIWQIGYPRNDILIKNDNQEARRKVIEYFSLAKDSMTVLYAPTYRKDKNVDVYDLDFREISAAFESKYGKKCVFLVRLHPNLVSKAGLIKYNSKIINASEYDDIQELMVASDVLITDYSNVMFEFSYQKKPCFLYAPDFEEYLQDRELYFEYNTLPYPIAFDNQQLINNIENFNNDKYEHKVSELLESINITEKGNASKVTVDKLLSVK
ncbi:CDP-glycerol glycerophosphotransferase family protein [Pediococcus acidilactici]|uniref:CDP-glycerol glycerophosphotransferase family protein n=1 Tax=Pediococcus acidilactici TaxID=1254 RepID=UPI0001BEDABC|nr:CDP-glycerol glycerophosphotransferase family protein [Pediococcus acidilactici]EFA26504.1 CDP-glycerol:poly(glycerophosphate) glycerophosphotransferase [Pediococcus acidilactici 7_4]MDB8870742.1 CDP-glycerol glycerophosphotransferase family protein [Pediococcus acidilactici]MDB8878489.1 CDP-glycerol glycerophosphotransferase family protein [Pediococcus acidilactici]QIO84966.1 CDP-glycerol--poly(glycerophosphate) glycerophosphotransferase [Pediococcus acidilactici]QJW86454.1 CDP-glycerol--p